MKRWGIHPRFLVLLAGLFFCLSFGNALAQDRASTVGVETSSSDITPDIAKDSKAAAHQDEQAEFKHSSSVKLVSKLTGLSLDNAYWLCVLLNFAVIAGAIAWASKKRLPVAFRDRSASIQHAMEEARKTSEDANRRLSDIELRLSQLGTEIEAMRSAAEKAGAAEEERIKAAAIEDARKIVESAEQEIAAAARTARRDLTAYAADLAVSLARKQIHVDTGTDEGLIRNFAQHLGDTRVEGPAKGDS